MDPVSVSLAGRWEQRDALTAVRHQGGQVSGQIVVKAIDVDTHACYLQTMANNTSSCTLWYEAGPPPSREFIIPSFQGEQTPHSPPPNQVVRINPLSVYDASKPDRPCHIAFDADAGAVVLNEPFFVVRVS
jgi:hypothetical protein